ncbi:MAG: hypothetical protein GY855_03725 [candidate division Zixibacteria bacterium]|nr:hypothetical protein [candidate division Zixibacteria bacterium]
MSELKLHYFVRLLGKRADWPDNMTEEEEKIMQEHFLYLQDLVKRKRIVAAGPVMGEVFGLVLLQVASEDEAKKIMENEPSVKGGIHTFKIQPMVLSLLTDFISPDRYVIDPTNRILTREVTVPASVEDVWEAWTTTEGVKTFFSTSANVQLRVGGRYEVYFLLDKEYGFRGSEDCKVLSFLPKQMLSFEWNAPPDFEKLRNKKTQVILQFEKSNDKEVKVTLTQHGWGTGNDWDKLYNYFDNAWSYVLDNLKRRFIEGPINWFE